MNTSGEKAAICEGAALDACGSTEQGVAASACSKVYSVRWSFSAGRVVVKLCLSRAMRSASAAGSVCSVEVCAVNCERRARSVWSADSRSAISCSSASWCWSSAVV